jgi:hypothetical protein
LRQLPAVPFTPLSINELEFPALRGVNVFIEKPHEKTKPAAAVVAGDQVHLAGGFNRRIQPAFEVLDKSPLRQALAMIHRVAPHLIFALLT